MSFRPSDEEEKIIERAMRQFGSKNRSAALRMLVLAAGQRVGKLSKDPVFKFRVPDRWTLPKGRTLTSREIDDELYGGHR